MSKLFSPIVVGAMRFGTWGAEFTQVELHGFVDKAIDLGLTTFDHADIYGDYTTEQDFGKILKTSPALRSKMQIITKCGIGLVSENRPDHWIKHYDSSKEHIISSVEQSLRNLHTEYIDVLLIHRPDMLLSAPDVAEAVDHLKSKGKILHFGVSNFTKDQMQLLNEHTDVVTNQIELSPLMIEPFTNGVLDYCQQVKIQPMAWSPFGGGQLFRNTKDPRLLKIIDTCKAIGKAHECTLDQVILAWIRKHPLKIIPVIGTSNISRLVSASNALSIELSRQEWYAIYESCLGHEVA